MASVSALALNGVQLLLVVLCIPIAILAIGAPIALAVKLVLLLVAMV
jgi:hypothetical protein